MEGKKEFAIHIRCFRHKTQVGRMTCRWAVGLCKQGFTSRICIKLFVCCCFRCVVDKDTGLRLLPFHSSRNLI